MSTTRALGAVLALACAALAAAGAHGHPLSPLAMAAACAIVALLCAWKFRYWPLWLLPCLPLAGLAPWTGWLMLEEWDLLLLAAAAGLHARMAAQPLMPIPRAGSVAALPWLFLLPWLGLTACAAWRGVVDAGGWSLAHAWWQGYREPLNALRLAKPTLWVALLWPAWRRLMVVDPEHARRVWLWAMVAMALAVAVPVVAERAAFTDLLNFSSDYRATGSFWEMHVGGAGLDAALALTLPAVLLALMTASSARGGLAGGSVLALQFYAAVVTFSRIVFAVLPLTAAVTLGLRHRQAPAAAARGGWGGTLAAAAVAAAAAGWLFPVAGYRGALAWLACVTLALAGGGSATRLPWRLRVPALVLGVLVVAAVAAITLLVPKGAYVACALAAIVGLAASWFAPRRSSPALSVLALAMLPAAAAALVAVAWHWGGNAAQARAAPLALAAGLWPWFWPPGRLPWPQDLRWQARSIGLATAAVALVAVFSAGDYMGERLHSSEQDVSTRREHWRLLVDLQRDATPLLLGIGLGRTPARLAMAGEPSLQAGDYRLQDGDGARRLLLTSGAHAQGWGEFLRISQRLSGVPGADAVLRLRVRPLTPLTLHAEVCAKHLLYDSGCRLASLKVVKGVGQWQEVALPLSAGKVSAGNWYAPRAVVFSVALDTRLGRAELAGLSLRDGSGREWLANGDFGQGLSRWFFSSDRHHMPWHAKNLAVHVLFEQGLLALLWLGGFGAWALVRTSIGAGARDPMAPALCAGLLGLAGVGMVDSVMDMPRIAFLGLWTLMLALAAAPPARAGTMAAASA
ncbi:MAG TPA: DUF2499 domain-containing protein [Rubrivivax sp.]|nr:DUF2499 domain-containing protein [Rubrivivax sp.]